MEILSHTSSDDREDYVDKDETPSSTNETENVSMNSRIAFSFYTI